MKTSKGLKARAARTARTAKAAVLVESSVSLWVVITTFVLSILLLINIGTIIYYKMKLAMVTTQTAAYAASIVVPSTQTWVHNQTTGASLTGLTNQATQYAMTALQNTGLTGHSAQPPNITVAYAPMGSDAFWVNVFITLPGLPLVGSASFLPSTMDLSDTACGVARYDQPPVLHQFIVSGTTLAPPGNEQPSLYMPGYGWAPGGASGAAPFDVMDLRSSYFNIAPTIIPMGIPSAGSGCPGTGTGFMSECWYDGTIMAPLPGGSGNY